MLLQVSVVGMRVCMCKTVALKMKARAPETNVSAYRLGYHDDRGMGKALLELPLKWRAESYCMPAHVHNTFS